MTKTVVGLFETQEAAEAGVNALLAHGYTNDQIGVALRGEIRAASASSNDPLLADVRDDADGTRKVLDEGLTSGWNAEEYADRLNYSGVVVTVQTDGPESAEVESILHRHGARDLAERRPSQTIDPSEAAVQEADAVDKPATDAVGRQIESAPPSSARGEQAAAVQPATATVPLASASAVAATKPTGIATLRPGDSDVGATTPPDHGTAPPTSPSAAASLPPAQGRARSYQGVTSGYQRTGDGYPTPDLDVNTEPGIVGNAPSVASTAVGADSAPLEHDQTVGEQFGGAMADPAVEASAEAQQNVALEES